MTVVRLAQSVGIIATSIGTRLLGPAQAVSNATNNREINVFILLLDSCALVYGCKLFLAFPHDHGMASHYQTELDVDVPLLAEV